MKKLLVAAAALVLILGAFAVQSVWVREQRLRSEERAEWLERQASAAAADHDWLTLLNASQELEQLHPGEPVAPYGVACAQARLGRPDLALVALERSVQKGFMESLHAQRDPDLASLQQDPRFQHVLGGMRRNMRDGEYERAGEIPGVKTVEGYAEDGFRWRLRMSPQATAEHPDRLLVWLHPTGSPANGALEAFAPQLTAHGWATLVVTRMPQWDSWGEDDLAALLERTVPGAGQTPGIDARRPVLVGFSAGGQGLLWYWAQGRPLDAAGLVLDAAYPVDTAPASHDAPIVPPKSPELLALPMLVWVGEDDPPSVLWREAGATWKAAGVPLTLKYVAHRGHEWLLDDASLPSLLEWLDARR